MRARIVLATLAGAALVATALPAPAQASAARNAVTYGVSISGTVSGRNFQRSGTLILRDTVTRVTTNGVNPVDVCLKSGLPAGTPETGAIWYGSSSACIRSTASLDMAYVTVNGTTVTVVPDKRVAATFANNFTATGSLTSCVYHPVDGGATYTFHDNGTVSGRISMRGFGGYPCGNSTYTATLTGRR